MHGFIVFLSSQYHLVVARRPEIVFGYLVSATGSQVGLPTQVQIQGNKFYFPVALVLEKFTWLFYYRLKLDQNLSGLILKAGLRELLLGYLNLCIGSPAGLLRTNS